MGGGGMGGGGMGGGGMGGSMLGQAGPRGGGMMQPTAPTPQAPVFGDTPQPRKLGMPTQHKPAARPHSPDELPSLDEIPSLNSAPKPKGGGAVPLNQLKPP
eukprot:5816068-Prymnesium_polylepis.1